jgi:hypothetical protein
VLLLVRTCEPLNDDALAHLGASRHVDELNLNE